jgi:hypothetical protein
MPKRFFMHATFSILAVTTSLLGSFATADSSAAVLVEENAQERINLSGKLRMLSQRIPSAACYIERGIAADSARELLIGASNEFEAILNALEFGDTARNIQQPETHRRTLAGIAALRARWEPLHTAAQDVVSGNATDAERAYLFTENMEVLRVAQRLVEELVKQYSNPNAVTRASLMQIDISGRQRMLTQKMSKETCLLGTDYANAATLSDLEGTARIFDASLEALRFGMDSVGIMPPPNSAISDGLTGVEADWTQVEPMIASVVAGETLGEDELAEKFHRLNTTMANMNAVVGLYAASAR